MLPIFTSAFSASGHKILYVRQLTFLAMKISLRSEAVNLWTKPFRKPRIISWNMNVWYKMSIDNLTLVLFGICLDLCEHLEAKLDGVLDFEGAKVPV